MSREEIMLGASVPQEWVDKFEELAKQTGRSLSELVREALAQYIGVSNNLPQLAELEAEIALLKQQVAEIEPYKNKFKTVLFRLEIIEKMMTQSQPEVISKQTFSDSKSLPVDTDDEDDFDEPDEILSDFLPR